MRYYIVEHPTRGTLRDVERVPVRSKATLAIEARFSTTGDRGDHNRTMRFANVEVAREVIAAIAAEKPKLADELRVRRSGDFKPLCPTCDEWAELWHEHARSCPVYREEVARHG